MYEATQPSKRSGSHGLAHVKRGLDQALKDVQPSTASGATDPLVQRVRILIQRWVTEKGATRIIHVLMTRDCAEAIDELLLLAHFNNEAPNQRLRWSRHLAYLYGQRGAVIVLLLIIDICRDEVVSVGACLAWRLRGLLKGGPAAVLPCVAHLRGFRRNGSP